MRAIFGPALVYAATNGISAGIPFLLLPVMTRILSPEEYGLVAMFSVVVAGMGALAGLSVHGAVGVRYFERAQYDFPCYVTTCLLILAGSMCVASVLIWLLAPFLEAVTSLPPPWLFAALAVAGAFFVVQIRLVIWQCANQPWKYGALRLGQSIVDATASLAMVVVLGMGWEGRVGGLALAAVVAALLAIMSLNHGGWLSARADRRYAMDAMKFGVPLIPHAIGGMLVGMVDRFMINSMLDVGSTGVYMVGLQIGMAIALLGDAFNKAYTPWLLDILNEKIAARNRQVVRSTYGYFMAAIVVAIVLGLFAPLILDVLVGERFQAAAPLVIYIAIGQAFASMYATVANYVFFAGRTARLAGVTLTAGAFNVLVSYWLLRENGVVGAAQAFMLAQVVLFLGTWWLAHQSHPMPWWSVFRPNKVSDKL